MIRKGTHLSGYRAVAGRIRTGPITIGADAVVGEGSVLDIGTGLGDRAQLGHASSLQCGQVVPDGESWHGSPAVRCDVDYRLVPPARCGRLRRAAYGLWQLANATLLSVPLALALVLHFLERIPLLPRLVEPGRTTAGDPAVNLQVFGYVTALFVGGILVGLLFIGTVPRLLQRGLREDAAHPLYGIRYWLYRIVARTTNSGFCCALFGDSSAILHYLRWVGYRFGRPLVQSGSNFGVAVGHENPYLSGVGSATMVSDGLSFMNAEYSNTSFRLRRAEVGARAAGIWARSPCVRPVVVEACPPESNCSTVVTRECGPDRDTDGESDSDDRGGLRRSNTITLYTGLLDDASDNGALATIVHEMGHALGLVHRNDPDSVMNAETDDSTDPVPDAIDFANLVAIYG